MPPMDSLFAAGRYEKTSHMLLDFADALRKDQKKNTPQKNQPFWLPVPLSVAVCR